MHVGKVAKLLHRKTHGGGAAFDGRNIFFAKHSAAIRRRNNVKQRKNGGLQIGFYARKEITEGGLIHAFPPRTGDAFMATETTAVVHPGDIIQGTDGTERHGHFYLVTECHRWGVGAVSRFNHNGIDHEVYHRFHPGQ